MAVPDPAAVPLPAGLPDPAMLARLAGEFFAALPGSAGGVPVPVNPHPGGVALPPSVSGPATPAAVPLGALPPGANLLPTSPQAPANGLAATPALLPQAQAGNGLPDSVVTAVPALDSRGGGHALGVPQAVGTGLSSPALAAPVTDVVQAPQSTAPGVASFYFIDVPGAASFGVPVAAAPGAQTPASGSLAAAPAQPAALPADDRIHALSFALPGADALRALQFGNGRAAPPMGAPGAPGNFYFLSTPDASSNTVPVARQGAHPPFDVHAIRRDFPILAERVNGRPLVWFDNAATTQKPQSVIDRLAYFYEHENSNIHRAAHELAARATDAYEDARETVRRFLGASSTEEIIFVRGTTEAINLVAKSWGARNIGPGDEIIVSHLEHHANIVPWQQLAAEKGAKLRVIPVDDSGQVLLEEYQRLLNDRTKLVSVTQVSNALGTVVPVKQIVDLAHRAGARALVDGAQSVSHMRVDMQQLDADLFVFSGHKIFGPTGIGVLYGKRDVLQDMPPWQGGGNMIADVTFEHTVYQDPPARFEAGTGNIADAVGLGAALEYVERIGLENIARYEHGLLDYATHHMRPIPGVRLIGTARDKASVLSFVLEGHTTEEVGKALNAEGIAVRTGHHCAQPILRRFGLETTVRPSLAFYNTCEEIDRMVAVVRQLSGKRR